MDKDKQEATHTHYDGSFQEFLDLLTQAYQQNRDYPHSLQQELGKLIKTGENMVQNVRCQVRKIETEEQQLSTDGQQRSDRLEEKGEENRVPTSGVSDRPSLEEEEEGKLLAKEVKVPLDDKKDVENKVEVAGSSHARSDRPSLEKEEEGKLLAKEVKVPIVDKKDVENKVEVADSSYARSDVRPTVEEVEESKLAAKEVKIPIVDKKDAENKVEVADSSHARFLEEELSNCRRDLKAKDREIEILMRRVAHYSDKRAKQDQQNVEETLSLNRQSKVEQDFKTFTSEERIDACIMIQEEFKEKTDVNAKRLTCLIFEAIYEYLFASKVAMIDAFKEISKFVVDNGADIGRDCFQQRLKKKEKLVEITIPPFRSGSEYSKDVLDGLLLSIKESAPNIKADIFLKDVKQEILRLAQVVDRGRSCKLPLSLKLLEALNDYLKASIKLIWRMVTLVPPLKLEYQTFTYNIDCHKVVEPQADVRTDRYQGQKVYYLWPGLMDGGGRIIIAGEVVQHQ